MACRPWRVPAPSPRSFGPRHYGAISGALALGANGARAVGPVGASLIVLALGAYERLFWALAVGLGAVGVAVLFTDLEVGSEETAARRATSP